MADENHIGDTNGIMDAMNTITEDSIVETQRGDETDSMSFALEESVNVADDNSNTIATDVNKQKHTNNSGFSGRNQIISTIAILKTARLAQIVAAALLLEHALVDASGGEIVGLLHARFDETLVVAQVQIGLGAVIGHEHFAVLEGRPMVPDYV
ncbi:hypothetical protein FQR65_LT19128 [Abscondita terminalis]|nr:hypothetical protein FQR65_LT19128 [Abscondita terminalis]